MLVRSAIRSNLRSIVSSAYPSSPSQSCIASTSFLPTQHFRLLRTFSSASPLTRDAKPSSSSSPSSQPEQQSTTAAAQASSPPSTESDSLEGKSIERELNRSDQDFQSFKPVSRDLDSILPGLTQTSLPGSAGGSSSSSSNAHASIDRSDPVNSFRPNPTIRGSLASNTHRLHVQTSRNNTILTLTNPEGEPLASASGGSAGFKKAARSGYEAGYRAAFNMFQKIGENRVKWGIGNLEMLWNGFGQGREAVYRALLANEGEETRSMIRRMTDKTPIKVGGVRPKKRRML
ncbi:translational machinery component [Violaceomyces palustris]|uniref:Translational machinery component n=1 Tax=Violaceomyces palustris TaxID=1673888 RepID=A0ACD0NNI8_9BASI|nr:translational machinery component [Violaceomyces palustris]